ncbi:MAG: DUF3095 family protein [Pseudomonadota bacterium]
MKASDKEGQNKSPTIEFTQRLPVQERFSNALPKGNYVPVPDDWFVAVTDVIKSRAAIAEGKYKSVNMAGASMISAIMNAVGHQELAYVFGGDGAAVTFGPDCLDAARDALSKTVTWVGEDLELGLRAAIVPVSEIRAVGNDVLVSAVKVSDTMNNFAFLGGGIAWAEDAMKSGRFVIAGAEAGSRPDLTGLSCRWTPVEEDGKRIVSLIVEPGTKGNELDPAIVGEIMRLVHADEEDASPMPKRGPGFTWPPKGLPLEAAASGMSKGLLYVITLLAWVLDRTGWNIGAFSPQRYREVTSANTDYRKIQDGIRMTICLGPEAVTELGEYLEQQRAAKTVRFGMFEQDQAVLTCFVPSIMEDNHFHFLDGAGGGYAAAADDLA